MKTVLAVNRNVAKLLCDMAHSTFVRNLNCTSGKCEIYLILYEFNEFDDVYLFSKLFHHRFALRIVLSFYSFSSSYSFYPFVCMTNFIFLVVVRLHVKWLYLKCAFIQDGMSIKLFVNDSSISVRCLLPILILNRIQCLVNTSESFWICDEWEMKIKCTMFQFNKCFPITNFVTDSKKQGEIKFSIAIFRSFTCATLSNFEHKDIQYTYNKKSILPQKLHEFSKIFICLLNILWFCTIRRIFQPNNSRFQQIQWKINRLQLKIENHVLLTWKFG